MCLVFHFTAQQRATGSGDLESNACALNAPRIHNTMRWILCKPTSGRFSQPSLNRLKFQYRRVWTCIAGFGSSNSYSSFEGSLRSFLFVESLDGKVLCCPTELFLCRHGQSQPQTINSSRVQWNNKLKVDHEPRKKLIPNRRRHINTSSHANSLQHRIFWAASQVGFFHSAFRPDLEIRLWPQKIHED